MSNPASGYAVGGPFSGREYRKHLGVPRGFA